MSVRCGKCKSWLWNGSKSDRKRKPAVESPVEVEEIPQVNIGDVLQTMDTGADPDRTAYLLYTRPVFEDGTVGETKTREITEEQFKAHNEIVAKIQGRCRHGLYSCPQCHPEKAA